MSVHPNDEALSAALDDEDAGALAHAGTCPVCQARLDQLGAVTRVVATPVTPLAATPGGEAVRRAAITAALDAAFAGDATFAGDTATAPTGDAALAGAAAPASHLAPAGHATPAGDAAPAPTGPSTGRSARDDLVVRRARTAAAKASRTSRLALGGLSAAAAVLLVLLGVVALAQGGQGARKSAAGSTASGTTNGAAGRQGPVVNGGDLGSVNDSAVLADEVASRLGVAGPLTKSAASPQAGSQAAAQGGAQAASQADAQAGPPAASGAATASTPAADSTGRSAGGFASAPSPAQSPTPASTTPPPGTPPLNLPADAVCVNEALTAGAAQLGSLKFHATLRWQGTSAEVLDFETAGSGLTHHLFVMALNGCGFLAVQSF